MQNYEPLKRKPDPADYTHNGDLQQPHYDNSVKAWEKLQELEQSEKVNMENNKIEDIKYLLERLEDYMENKADSIDEGIGIAPNAEMSFLVDIRDALEALSQPSPHFKNIEAAIEKARGELYPLDTMSFRKGYFMGMKAQPSPHLERGVDEKYCKCTCATELQYMNCDKQCERVLAEKQQPKADAGMFERAKEFIDKSIENYKGFELTDWGKGRLEILEDIKKHFEWIDEQNEQQPSPKT